MAEKKEHSFSPRNPSAFQASIGIENLFEDAAEFATCKDNCIHLFDEENQKRKQRKYSPEYELTAELFGSHGFNIRYWT